MSRLARMAAVFQGSGSFFSPLLPGNGTISVLSKIPAFSSQENVAPRKARSIRGLADLARECLDGTRHGSKSSPATFEKAGNPFPGRAESNLPGFSARSSERMFCCTFLGDFRDLHLPKPHRGGRENTRHRPGTAPRGPTNGARFSTSSLCAARFAVTARFLLGKREISLPESIFT